MILKRKTLSNFSLQGEPEKTSVWGGEFKYRGIRISNPFPAKTKACSVGATLQFNVLSLFFACQVQMEFLK